VALFVLAALSSSCQTIEIPDVEVCASGAGGIGICRTTISERERRIDRFQWASCKDPDLPCVSLMLHISPLDSGKIFKTIETFCEKYQVCVAEDIEQMEHFVIEMCELRGQP